jgi:DNA-directed RNA polymerase subunit L
VITTAACFFQFRVVAGKARTGGFFMSAFSRIRKPQAPHSAAVEYLSRDLSNNIRYKVSLEIKRYNRALARADHPLTIRDIKNELTALEEFKVWATSIDSIANRIKKAEKNITLATFTHKINEDVEICYELAHTSERNINDYINTTFEMPAEKDKGVIAPEITKILEQRIKAQDAANKAIEKGLSDLEDQSLSAEQKNDITKFITKAMNERVNEKGLNPYCDRNWREQADEVMMQRRVERRRLNKLIRHDREAIALHLGIVGGRGYNHKRCTKACYLDQSHRNAKNEHWLENTVAIGAGGEVIKLSDAAQTKRKQVCEMYAFAKGIQEHAIASDMQWATIVVTLPELVSI